MASLPQLRRRQLELTFVAVGLLLLAAVTTGVMAVDRGEWLLAASLGILCILFGGYVLDTELKMRTLSKKLLDEEFAYLEAQAHETILNKKVQELTALRTALEAMARERHPEKALDTIIREACTLCGASRGSIMLVDQQTQRFVIVASQGLKAEYRNQVQRIDGSVAGQVVASGRPLLLTGDLKVSNINAFIQKETVLRSSICVPLRTAGIVVGVLNCSSTSDQGRVFTEYDLELISLLAHYAELALERGLQGGMPSRFPQQMH